MPTQNYRIKSSSRLGFVAAALFRLVPAGVLIAGPPCSIFVNACVSMHKRCETQPEGDLNVYLVRLANRIWLNFVLWKNGSVWECLGKTTKV